jgi:hypothetical protein
MKTYQTKRTQTIIAIFWLLQTVILTSCKSKENLEPQNTITLKYRGQLLEYKNVEIYKGYWNPNEGIVASGKIDYSAKDNTTYSIVKIYLQKEPNGEYSFYEINFGKAPETTPNSFTMYKANLSKESDRATFQAKVNQKNNELTGDFSGKLKVLIDSKIEITEGKYSLFLSTVKGD